MIVSGRVLDENGGRCAMRSSRSGRRTRPDATGTRSTSTTRRSIPTSPAAGRVVTDAEGRYRFKTIKPGAYPWRNHYNAWRPAHIHLSIFGHGFMQRLVTQFYFPGDPLLEYDPMYMGVPDERARKRLIAEFDWEHAEPEHAIAYRFDIVLRGRDATPMERR